MKPFSLQVMKKAREIFSLYIARTAKRYIGLKITIVQQIQLELSPPYEELFDEAEVYALEHLLQAWQGMNMKDRQLLKEVDILCDHTYMYMYM